MLSLPEKEEFAHSSSVVYFSVNNLDKAYEQLLNHGVEVLGKPHQVAKTGDTVTWMVFFKDSEQNTHALVSEVQS